MTTFEQTKNQDYIGFYIDSNLKKEFQKLCIDKDTDVTTMLKSYINESVKKHKEIDAYFIEKES